MSEEATQPTQIDEETPARLRRQGGERLLQQVTRSFVDHWEGRLEELVEAIASGRSREAGDRAHGLRSSSDLVGLVGLGRLLARLEAEAGTAASSGPAAAARVRDELHSAFEQVRPWIEQRTGR